MGKFVPSVLGAAALAVMAGSASAAMVAEKIPYTLDGTKFEGVLVYDDATSAARPAIVMAPNWMGVTDAAVKKAEMLAKDKYVLFVADMYGIDVRPKNGQEAGAASGAVHKDLAVERARINKALDVLLAEGKKRGIIDAGRVAAIGFCFGGSNVLEMARSGRDIKGVVTFHGTIQSPHPDASKVKAKLLVLQGADDPFVPLSAREAFEAEMKANPAVDWQLVAFSGTVHSFTDPSANIPGKAMYNARTTKRAYRMMYDFFDEIL